MNEENTSRLDEIKSAPFIQAQGLTMNSIIGTPYRNVDLSVPRNSFVVINGEDCTGKTPLLLTLAGRMAPSKGTLTVGGFVSPKERNKIARIAGLGLFHGINDLDENLTCKAQLRAELELYGKPNRADDLRDYFATWRLEHIMDKRVRDLAHYDLIKLGIALGMANDPQMLVVDDVEEKLTYEQLHRVLEVLQDLAHNGHKVVVAACTEPSLASYADVSLQLRRAK